MFNLRFTIAIIALAAIVACCGGNGSGTPALGGVAAVGTPIVGGNISVICAAGSALSTTTSSTGAWQVTLSGQTLPCAVEVTGGTINGAANTETYTSIATALGTVNVTPLTDLLVANLVGTVTPSTWFAGLSTNPTPLAAITQTQVNTALAHLSAALSALTPLSTTNPITTPFTPTSGNVSDDMLTALAAAIASNTDGVTYASLLSDASVAFFTAPVAGFGTALANAYAATPSGTPTGGVTYSTSDLQGVWRANSLASGPGAPWWERAQVTIAADGSFNGTTTSSGGSSGTVSGTFGISTDGLVTFTGRSTCGGFMDAGKTVMVITDTWGGDTFPGTTEMKVFTKMADTYSLSDLAGISGIVDLGTGPGAPWWSRAQVNITATGDFNETELHNGGHSETHTGVLNISSDGLVTLNGSSTSWGVADAGKTVIVSTDTWGGNTDPGTTVMGVGVKLAGTYSSSDMVGTWGINALASGPGQPWWRRAQVTIAVDGSFTGTTTDSNGGSGTISGVLSISSDGIVTLAGSSTFGGFMDASKTIMVWTDTWSGTNSGTTEMDVATKIN